MNKYDPIIGADIMNMLGIGGEKADIPSVFGRVSEIAEYFQSKGDYKYEVLKVLNSRIAREDKLGALWSYVQLQKQKNSKIEQLNPHDFGEDVVNELNQGFLTTGRKKLILENIKAQKQRLIEEQRFQHDQTLKNQLNHNIEELSRDKLNLYEDVIEEIDQLDLTLNNFR